MSIMQTRNRGETNRANGGNIWFNGRKKGLTGQNSIIFLRIPALRRDKSTRLLSFNSIM